MNVKTMWKKLRDAAGFTLVELIVVIAILGILAGVAVPVYSGYMKKANLAADNELLAEVNRAFVSACMVHGVDNYKSGATATIGTDKKVASVTAPDVNATEFYATFNTFYEGGEFKEYLTLKHNSNTGMFEGKAATGAYDGLAGSFDPTDIGLFNGSQFARIGVNSLMNQVDMAQKVALAASEGSTLYKLVFDGGNITALTEYVGGEEALEALFQERAAQLAATNAEGLSDEAILEQAEKEVIANYAVLMAATKTSFDTDAFVAQLAAGNGKDTIKDSMDEETDNQKALAQTAMAYALYTSYITRNGGTATNNIFEVLDVLESDGFKDYMNNTDGNGYAAVDLDGYLGAMNMIESASGDKTAGKNLLVNGFTDPELLALLNRELGG